MASISLVLTITSAASTAVTFTPASPWSGSGSAFTAAGPIASGTAVGTIAVAPTTWQGVLSLGGTQASSFSLSGTSLMTAAALAAGVYDVTITATP